MIRRKCLICLGFVVFLGVGILGSLPGFGSEQPSIRVNRDQPTPGEQSLEEGAIRVILRSQPDREMDWKLHLDYQVFYNDQLQLSDRRETYYFGEVSFRPLQGRSSLDVVVTTFTGGSRCCLQYEIFSWRGDRFERVDIGPLDGGGEFKDLDGDGREELVAIDPAFLYTFAPYVGSFPPSAIYRLEQDRLVNVTQEYPTYLKARAMEMYTTIMEAKQDKIPVNGALAGYVGQMALIGEFESAWQVMLENYDPTIDWGLTRYNDAGEVIQEFPDFPTALRFFLEEQGYI